MPSSLSKVQKHVKKKKGSKINSLHENSRDVQRLRRAGARDDRVAKVSAVREKVNNLWIDRVAFFRGRLPDTLHPLELDTIHTLIQEYLARHDDEINGLKAERRPGRPANPRQTQLEQHRKVEVQEYDSGYWLPNLQDEETLIKLDAWKGEWVGLAVMRFLRVEKGGGVKESHFPPRGSS